MSIDAEFSVFISFCMFAYLFYDKVCPLLINYLDDYIESVKMKIQRSEERKKTAYGALKTAYANRDAAKKAIVDNQKRSDEKVAKLRVENAEYLKALRLRHEAALKTQLEAEAAKQKNLLINKLSDAIVNEVECQVVSGEREFAINVDKKDLYRLLGEERRSIPR